MVEWGWYAEAYRAIHDKIAEVLAKLDAPSDPQTAQLLDNLGNILFDNPAKYLPVRLTDGTSFYAAGGGAGGGLVQCQIRNEANTDWINEPYARDVLDRADRLLGRVYGSQGQQLLQRATTYDLIVQLRHAEAEIDPRQIRALTPSDVVDISDRAARDLGHLDIDNFPSNFPLPSTQVSDLKNITDITKTATQKKIDITATGIIHTPASGRKIRLKGFSWSSNADIVTALRFGTTGDLLFPLQAKGVIGMNLIGCNIEGGVDEALYGYLSGTGAMKGTVLLEEV